jgi:putative transposase
MARTKRELPAGLTEETLDALVAGVHTQAEFDVVFQGLKNALTERILRAELTEHLGYPEGAERPGDDERAERHDAQDGADRERHLIARDPAGSEEQLCSLVRAEGGAPAFEFDPKVLSPYACGLTVRELQTTSKSDYGAPRARRARHPDSADRWPHGVSGGDRGGVSGRGIH